ncbi:RNA polymerase sigma factor [Plantactinospora soyae]|uniref:RNA polymerase sigma-70 factor (ECF subfamily) n=1 Tax=Plantactinospora soyae TaxID=1544732 RepID=A0A927M8A1_9ACTN|nr:sigma-70 family RNA polymerase sigma factor [Plantactinospora soyae]MBE1486310.1 RNA polymerase sigma-70 factor (ECF subfamily) [Plantactinospora soyae]
MTGPPLVTAPPVCAVDPGSLAGTDPPDDVAAVADAVLIRQSRTEPERFALLFDRYYPEIHRFAANRLGPTAADDLAAETFLIAFVKRARFDTGDPADDDGAPADRAGDAGTGREARESTGECVPGGHVRAWLYGIATNLVRRQRRSEQRRYRALARAPRDSSVVGHDERIAAMVSAQSVQRDLAGALASLSARDRDVLLLVALGELTYHEVAAALEIPYGTVCSRLSRARRKVRKALGDTDPTGHDRDLGDL